MPGYYVDHNEKRNGDHEVHVIGCSRFPVERLYLGEFADAEAAVKEARRFYRQVAVCARCVGGKTPEWKGQESRR